MMTTQFRGYDMQYRRPAASGFGHSCKLSDDFVLDSTRMKFAAPYYRDKWGAVLPARVWDSINHFCTEESMRHHLNWNGPQDGDVAHPDATKVLQEIDKETAEAEAAIALAKQAAGPAVNPAILDILSKPKASTAPVAPPKSDKTMILVGLATAAVVAAVILKRRNA